MAVRLRPLRDDEVRSFIDGLRQEYVRGLTEDAAMSEEEAEEKARADHASLFPDGQRQADQHMYVVEDDAGQRVGHLFWAKRRPQGSTDRLFLYDIYIEEGCRGRGLGRRAMELLEDEARAADLPGIDLNVWGGNETARNLYRSLGFAERAVFMSKELN